MWEWVRRAVLHSLSTALLRLWKWVQAFWYKNGLLTLSMLSVVTGCFLGFVLRALELTDLVSLAGSQWHGVGQGGKPRKGPRWAQPKSKGCCPRKPPRTNPASLQWEWGALGWTPWGCRSLEVG